MFGGKGSWISSGKGKDDGGTLVRVASELPFPAFFCITFLGLYDIGMVYVFAIVRMTKVGLVSPETSRTSCFSS